MNKDLLAATSVFAEMVNNNIDYRTIIDDFVISVFQLENCHTLNSQEVLNFLVKNYDFDIPEALVITHLKRLRNQNKLTSSLGKFTITKIEFNSQLNLKAKLEEKGEKQKSIIDDLIKYIEFDIGKLTSEQKVNLDKQFVKYLFDDTFNGDYSDRISKFIIINAKNPDFHNELNLIREGITILRGIKYTSDSTDIQNWNRELTIYLDTEHLFSINGLNGELYKTMILDFYNLVREINTKVKKRLIKLMYVQDVEDEIKYFFNTAKEIKEGKKTKNISKPAMEEILQGTNTISDIIIKESKFFQNLTTMGIFKIQDSNVPDEQYAKYNIQTNELLVKYGNDKEVDENKVLTILKSFSLINFLRKGKNNDSLENIGHIILTGDFLTRSLSRDIESKVNETDFSFATDLYYLTQRLWYKLNKGLGFKSKIPTTLDVVSKAQVVLSSKLNSEVSKRFRKITSEVIEGKRTENDVKDYYLMLRSHTVKPEELDSENITEKALFLYEDDDIDKFIREQSLLKNELDELKKFKLEKETEEIEIIKKQEEKLNKEKEKEIKKHNKRINRTKHILKGLVIVIPFIIITAIIYSTIKSDESFFSTYRTILSTITFIYFLGFKKLLIKIENTYRNKLLSNEKG